MNDMIQNATLIDPSMKEIVDSFLVETKEILEKLDFDLLELEKKPEDADLINQIFRSFHTIKGTSGFLGLEKLPHVTHKCEDILNKLRKGEIKLSPAIMDGIILAFDIIKELVKRIEIDKNEEVEIGKSDSVLENLLAEIENKKNTEPVSQAQGAAAKQDQPVANVESIGTEEVQQIPKEDQQAKPTSVKKNTSTASVAENSIRVDVDRLDALLDIVSELVLGRNRLSQVTSKFGLEYEAIKYSKDFEEVTKQIDLMTTELQLVVMKLRMIKIQKIFNRYPRVVRDLSKELKKDVDLVIRGEETEVDKNLIEEINDPLVHLIRNSVDHGVETPAVRVKAGKNPKGTVILSAEHIGNNIVITVEDDGKGIDPNIIKKKAIEKKLITSERAKELTKQEIINLIFLPGFSTSEIVSNVSGRGVGMDVVKTNVTKLQGIINTESEPGKGTKIIIKLPLTLAIISGMIVKARNEFFVIPLGSVVEVLRVRKDQIHTIKGKEIINLRESLLPLVALDQLFAGRINGRKKNENLWQYVVEVGIAEQRFGIKVDELIGQQEVVIKSLGAYLGKIDGIAGSTIMGDGTVVMIVDVNELFNRLEKSS